MRKTATLKKWYIEEYEGNYHLVGEVYNHIGFTNGTTVKTSILLRIDFQEHEAETLNTHYFLED